MDAAPCGTGRKKPSDILHEILTLLLVWIVDTNSQHAPLRAIGKGAPPSGSTSIVCSLIARRLDGEILCSLRKAAKCSYVLRFPTLTHSRACPELSRL